jgi:hypothetical protein
MRLPVCPLARADYMHRAHCYRPGPP